MCACREALPLDREAFGDAVEDFMEVARYVRRKCIARQASNELELKGQVPNGAKKDAAGVRQLEERFAADGAREAKRRQHAEMRKATAEAIAVNDRLTKSSNAAKYHLEAGSSPVSHRSSVAVGPATARGSVSDRSPKSEGAQGEQNGAHGERQLARAEARIKKAEADEKSALSSPRTPQQLSPRSPRGVVSPEQSPGGSSKSEQLTKVRNELRATHSNEKGSVTAPLSMRLPDSRQEMLRSVHQAMDVDNSGYIEAAELMLLGQARRELGHKSGKWTAEMNRRLVSKLDTSHGGRIESVEFCGYFDRTLPESKSQFEAIIEQFTAAASHVSAAASQEVRITEREAALEIEQKMKQEAATQAEEGEAAKRAAIAVVKQGAAAKSAEEEEAKQAAEATAAREAKFAEREAALKAKQKTKEFAEREAALKAKQKATVDAQAAEQNTFAEREAAMKAKQKAKVNGKGTEEKFEARLEQWEKAESPKSISQQREARDEQLRAVFREFDYDDSGATNQL